MQIIHFHKAPGERISSWADVSSDEEKSPRSPPRLARKVEPDAMDVRISKKPALRDIAQKSLQAALHEIKPDSMDSHDLSELPLQATRVTTPPAEVEELEEVAVGHRFQVSSNKMFANPTCDCAVDRQDTIRLLRANGVTAKKFKGVYDRFHNYCRPCSGYVAKHLEVKAASLNRRNKESTVPLGNKAAGKPARQLKLADLLPPAEQSWQTRANHTIFI